MTVVLRGDRGSQLPALADVRHHRAGWRSPSGATDRNVAAAAYLDKRRRVWRSPSGGTEDRNDLITATLKTVAHVAVALRGDRGSQHQGVQEDVPACHR
ncbi:hypothetical protein GCM10022232_58830 [Streptomyces plumbiresistens]|uniref:Transposase n=1 Tax=Streptomyces plumbiresistens TaxID=511811 RepID=A0ABP7SDB3_9ACTN